MPSNFVSLGTMVASVLLEIGDEGNKKYLIRARQWILDEYRRVNTSISDVYLERKIEVDENNIGEIPEDSVKIISVGVYRNGTYRPFMKRNDLSILAEDISDGIYDQTQTANDIGTSTNPVNGLGYWMEDKEHGRLFVRNFRVDLEGTVQDTTSNIRNRVVIRYRTTGLNIGGDIQIPIEARDFIVAAVAYKFAVKAIPIRLTNAALNSQAIQVDIYKDDYTALLYEPQSFYEVKDALFGI